MADELDSGSSVGYRVWVQVPSPAYFKWRTDVCHFFCAIKRSINFLSIDTPCYTAGSIIFPISFSTFTPGF